MCNNCSINIRPSKAGFQPGVLAPQGVLNSISGCAGKITYVAVRGEGNIMHCICLFFMLTVTKF